MEWVKTVNNKNKQNRIKSTSYRVKDKMGSLQLKNKKSVMNK